MTDKSVPQRERNIAEAKELMAAAGMAKGFETTLTTERYLEIPDYAVLVQNASSIPGSIREFATGRANERTLGRAIHRAEVTVAQERRERLAQLVASPTFLTGLAIVGIWVTCAIFGHAMVPYDPYADDMLNTLLPPSREHLLGTDQLGRDVFSRVIAGSRDIT
jgi:hypothetical protein